jgi:hypothetical protein
MTSPPVAKFSAGCTLAAAQLYGMPALAWRGRICHKEGRINNMIGHIRRVI